MLRAGHVGSELFILAAGFSLDFFSATTIIEPATQITLVATLVPALKTPHTTPTVNHVYIEIQRDISFDLKKIVSRFISAVEMGCEKSHKATYYTDYGKHCGHTTKLGDNTMGAHY